jgi:hypothetical protein
MLLTYSRPAFKKRPAIGDETLHVGWPAGLNVDDAERFQLIVGDRDPDREEGSLSARRD